jgi:hypothetical protein
MTEFLLLLDAKGGGQKPYSHRAIGIRAWYGEASLA